MAALAGSLFIGGLLASCGGRLEEVLDKLLDKSRLLSVTATPNPVPAPADGSSTPFALRVDFDSNNSLDVIRVLLENPAGSGNYVLIGQPDACQGGTAEACGNGSITIQCSSLSTSYGPSYRAVTCAGGADATTLAAETIRARVEIIGRRILGGYSSDEADDRLDFSLVVQ